MIGFLGAATVLGFDPGQLLRADPVELAALSRVASAAAEYQQRRDVALARTVVNELAHALKRGR